MITRHRLTMIPMVMALWTILGAAPNESRATGLLSRLETEIQKLTADRSGSVVTVRAIRLQSTQGELREVFIGTGVVFDSGWILTTPSVIASGVSYSVQTRGEVPVPAEMVAYNADLQTAVFHAPALTAPPAPFARDSLLMPGQLLFVLGNAYGVEGAVSWGVAAGVRDDGLWQIGVNVAPGTSGSPVINTSGDVVGIVVAALTGQGGSGTGFFGGGVALMIPTSRNLPLAHRMKSEGGVDRAFLGVRPETVEPNLARALGLSHGVLIGAVSFGSPAYSAGLRSGDIIIELDARSIMHEQTLRRLLAEHCPGEEVELVIVREQQVSTVTVRLGRVPELLPERPAVPSYSVQSLAAGRSGAGPDSALLDSQIHLLEQRLADLKRQLDRP